jgi:hypothetical protein
MNETRSIVWPCIEWRPPSSSNTSNRDITPHANIHICAVEVMSVVNTLVEYLRKLSFNISWNICCPPLYCLSVQTDGFRFLHAVSGSEDFVVLQVNSSVQNHVHKKASMTSQLTGIFQNSLQRLVLKNQNISVKYFVILSACEVEKLLFVFWILLHMTLRLFLTEPFSVRCSWSTLLSFIFCFFILMLSAVDSVSVADDITQNTCL